jgi:hypothetical protein
VEQDTGSGPAGTGSDADGRADPEVHVVDYSRAGSTLLPMLIIGIVLIVAGMVAVMVLF